MYLHRHHGRQQRGARGQMLQKDGFMRGVRAFADCTHTVERGYAQRRSEVASNVGAMVCGPDCQGLPVAI